VPYEEGETTAEYIRRCWKRLHELPHRIIKFQRDGKPIDLRAYEIMQAIERERQLPPKVLAELIKHKDALHPYMRKRLLETLRSKAKLHRDKVDYLDGIADQLE
jgi:hypothetical protein